MTVVVGLQFVKAELYYQEIIDLITMDHFWNFKNTFKIFDWGFILVALQPAGY